MSGSIGTSVPAGSVLSVMTVLSARLPQTTRGNLLSVAIINSEFWVFYLLHLLEIKENRADGVQLET
jgi:hypothetical protein